MSNKILVGLLAVMILGIGYFVMQGKSSTSSQSSGGDGNTVITLSTNPNPLTFGPATFVIEVKDKNGKSVDNAKVSFDLNMTSMNMGTQQGDATSQGNGKYAATGKMTMRGPWRVATKVTLPDGSITNKDFTVNVP